MGLWGNPERDRKGNYFDELEKPLIVITVAESPLRRPFTCTIAPDLKDTMTRKEMTIFHCVDFFSVNRWRSWKSVEAQIDRTSHDWPISWLHARELMKLDWLNGSTGLPWRSCRRSIPRDVSRPAAGIADMLTVSTPISFTNKLIFTQDKTVSECARGLQRFRLAQKILLHFQSQRHFRFIT